MTDPNFLLYILSQVISTINPKMVVLLREWYEQFSCEPKASFDSAEFCRTIDLSLEQTQKFSKLFKDRSPAKLVRQLENSQTKPLHLFSAQYPKLLSHITDPPLILYCRGNLKLLEQEATLAIVGSRRATSYGELAVEKIISGLISQPITVISGLAYGIDAIAHRTALEHNLPTIAVLGSSLDNNCIYPRENVQLAEDILNHNGLLVSEYPPQTLARQHQFIARNRIIAGLSQITVIAEAALKSGALITADFAVEYNRTVMALPGSIFSPSSYGPHQLIQQGAALLTASAELLAEFNLQPCQHPTNQNQLTEQETIVLEYIQHEPLEFDKLITLTKLDPNQLQVILSSLTLKSLIVEVGSQIYQLAP